MHTHHETLLNLSEPVVKDLTLKNCIYLFYLCLDLNYEGEPSVKKRHGKVIVATSGFKGHKHINFRHLGLSLNSLVTTDSLIMIQQTEYNSELFHLLKKICILQEMNK